MARLTLRTQYQEDPGRQSRATATVDLADPAGSDGSARGPDGGGDLLGQRRERLCHWRGLASGRWLHRHLALIFCFWYSAFGSALCGRLWVPGLQGLSAVQI